MWSGMPPPAEFDPSDDDHFYTLTFQRLKKDAPNAKRALAIIVNSAQGYTQFLKITINETVLPNGKGISVKLAR